MCSASVSTYFSTTYVIKAKVSAKGIGVSDGLSVFLLPVFSVVCLSVKRPKHNLPNSCL